MSKNYWTSRQDFEDDLFAISDFSDVPYQRPKEPVISFHTRRARSKPSIYDDLPEEVEQERPMRLGRGAVISRSNLRRPGGVPSFIKDEHEIARDIREASGIGFSNTLIEDSLRSKMNEPVKSDYKVEMPDIRLKTSASSSSSSSPNYFTSSEESPVPSPQLKEKIAATPHTKTKFVSVDKPPVQENKNLPSLYDMLKSSKHTRRVERKVDTKKSFDINSKNDFPQLN